MIVQSDAKTLLFIIGLSMIDSVLAFQTLFDPAINAFVIATKLGFGVLWTIIVICVWLSLVLLGIYASLAFASWIGKTIFIVSKDFLYRIKILKRPKIPPYPSIRISH